ncbi:hypothetical protein GM3709_820 [Geminocystis sp. NIES-3709]|nr:hypothetical protein GM3709_820 [Geminocystis sp. NIES-3709]
MVSEDCFDKQPLFLREVIMTLIYHYLYCTNYLDVNFLIKVHDRGFYFYNISFILILIS